MTRFWLAPHLRFYTAMTVPVTRGCHQTNKSYNSLKWFSQRERERYFMLRRRCYTNPFRNKLCKVVYENHLLNIVMSFVYVFVYVSIILNVYFTVLYTAYSWLSP